MKLTISNSNKVCKLAEVIKNQCIDLDNDWYLHTIATDYIKNTVENIKRDCDSILELIDKENEKI